MIDFDENDEENVTLYADGFEDALVGIGQQFNNTGIAIYDIDKCIDILVTRDGMSSEDAWEFFEFNVTGAYVGPKTPIYAYFSSE